MQLLDENGNILHEWSNNSIMFNDLLAGESYIIHVTGTPAGFFNPQDQTITVPHRASSDQPLSATVCFYPFSVSINVLDKNTGIISAAPGHMKMSARDPVSLSGEQRRSFSSRPTIMSSRILRISRSLLSMIRSVQERSRDRPAMRILQLSV